MAIHDITYKIEQESGVTTTDNKKFDQTARLTFSATSNSPSTDNTHTMRNDAAAPKIGFPHPFIPNLFATGVNCKKISAYLYEFDVGFTGRGKDGESPLDEPPVIEFDFAISEEAYDVDYEGTPILFITGEPPDPPVKDTVYDLVIRVSRNLAWVDPDVMSLYAGAINSDYFLGLPPGTVKITEPPKAKSADWEGTTYYTATIGFTVRRGIPGLYDDEKAWWKRTLAQGYYVRTFKAGASSGATIIAHARDKDGDKVTKPVLHSLEGGTANSGFMLPRNADTGLQNPQDAEWYYFKPRLPPRPFANLQIVD